MTDIIDDDGEACLDLNISEGPRKVLEKLNQINRDASFQRVCLSRNFASPLRALTTEILFSEVLEAIVALPNAPYLKISYASATFPIHLLMHALAHGSATVSKNKKKTLDLLGVKFSYKQTMAAIRVLQENSQTFPLQSISLENCRPESPPNARIRRQQKGQPLDLYLTALSTVSSLESMSLRLIEKNFLQTDFVPFPHLKKLHLERLHVSENSLHTIGQFRQLEELRLIFIVDPPQNPVLQTLATVLIDNHTLHTLQIKFLFHNLHCLDEEAHNAFWRMLAVNDTLQDIDLTMNWRMNPYESVFGVPIAMALEQNRSLQKLSLSTRIDDNETARENLQQSLVLIADALKSNQRLSQFSFSLSGGLRGYPKEKVYKTLLLDPFSTLLRDQYWLECLTLWYRGVGQLELTHEMQFYLDLNRAGRRKLLMEENPTHRQWTDAVIANQYDLSIVFFLLSRNPLLCQSMVVLEA